MLGRLHHGRDTIAREHQQIFDTIYLGSTLELRATDSRAIADNVLLVHTTSTLRVPAGPRAGDTDCTQTMIVSDGQILAFHNTIQAPIR